MDFDDVIDGVGYAFKFLGQLVMVILMWIGMIAAGVVIVRYIAAIIKGLLEAL